MDKVKRFRAIAYIEGVSFLVLLFVAMPLKYGFDMPIATKIAGSIHGALFMLFCLFLYQAARAHGWSYSFRSLAFVSSLLPFGMFWLDKRLQKVTC